MGTTDRRVRKVVCKRSVTRVMFFGGFPSVQQRRHPLPGRCVRTLVRVSFASGFAELLAHGREIIVLRHPEYRSPIRHTYTYTSYRENKM